MLAAEDPIAIALLKKYNGLPMPNLRINRQEANDLLDYIATETDRLKRITATKVPVDVRANPESAGADVVAVMNAWIRATDKDAKANAGYMTLINLADDEMGVIAISSPAFEKVEMHEMVLSNGTMKMSELSSVAIPAHGQALFAPGGRHLMMHARKGDHLAAGQTVDITLEFDNGQQQTFTVKVISK